MTWQPIESAPADEFCLVSIPYDGQSYVTIGRLFSLSEDESEWLGEDDMRLKEPSHWMALPAPAVMA